MLSAYTTIAKPPIIFFLPNVTFTFRIGLLTKKPKLLFIA